ncbi:sensor domain-containing diguanylate cyclase [Rheinheimera fenheensis]|uniref:sensor domain-containing diguanylate cyclase n=1 Tax=Rheinheimera fenheensis TaxID=3152295 RepID=UPI0032619199
MQISNIDAEALVRSLHEGVVVHAAGTQVLYANPSALRLLRLTKEQMLGKDAFDPGWRFLESDGRQMAVSRYPVQQVLLTLQPLMNFELGICDSSTEQVTWVLCNAYPEFDDQQQLIQIVVSFVDITHKKNDIPFDRLVEIANDLVVITTASSASYAEQRIMYVNQAFVELTGFKRQQLIGQSPKLFMGQETDSAKLTAINRALKKLQPFHTQLSYVKPDGEKLWLDVNIVPLNNDLGELAYYAAIERDISAAKQYEAHLKELATRDQLTTLLNRRGFWELAQQLLPNMNRHKREVCFAMLDIDQFKTINDTFGHAVGDRVLSQFGLLMTKFFREADVLARIGGEEFAVLMPDASMQHTLERLDRFRQVVSASAVECDDTRRPIYFSVSIGLTSAIGSNLKLDLLLKAADKALYQAKHSGRNKVCFQAVELAT